MESNDRSNVAPRLMSRKATISLLTRLEADSAISHVVKYLPPDMLNGLDLSPMATISSEFDNQTTDSIDWSWLPSSARKSGTGIACVYTKSNHQHAYTPAFAVAPPFPINAETISDDFKALRGLIELKCHVGIVLLRLGRFAVGITHNEQLVASKSDSRYVRGRHRAGGQSANRFKRNRDKWMREFFDKTSQTASAMFKKYNKHHIGWLALGGDHHILQMFLQRATLPHNLTDHILPRYLPLERPGRDSLERAARDVWSSQVYIRRETDQHINLSDIHSSEWFPKVSNQVKLDSAFDR